MGINKIRVLIAEDSLVFSNFLKQGLSNDVFIEIVGVAKDGDEVREQLKQLEPDVVTLDLNMPKVSGLSLLESILEENKVKVVVVTSLNFDVFDALILGAVDFVKKPEGKNTWEHEQFFLEVKSKIKIANVAKLREKTSTLQTDVEEVKKLNNNSVKMLNTCLCNNVVAIGASTGGTEAIAEILKNLPVDFPGVVVTQHMPAGFTKMYANRMNNICKIEVKEAENGDRILKGQALIAPGDKQMRVCKDAKGYYVSCLLGEKISGHCPSVDVLFDSVADTVGKNSVGILLTGMGKDGSVGLLNMKNKGAYTIGQDKDSCVVYGMPKVAFDIGAVSVQCAISEIANHLIKYLNKK